MLAFDVEFLVLNLEAHSVVPILVFAYTVGPISGCHETAAHAANVLLLTGPLWPSVHPAVRAGFPHHPVSQEKTQSCSEVPSEEEVAKKQQDSY